MHTQPTSCVDSSFIHASFMLRISIFSFLIIHLFDPFSMFSGAAEKLDDLLLENIPGSIQYFLQDFLLSKSENKTHNSSNKSNPAETSTSFTSFHIVSHRSRNLRLNQQLPQLIRIHLVTLSSLYTFIQYRVGERNKIWSRPRCGYPVGFCAHKCPMFL